jgi:hypothetical protein
VNYVTIVVRKTRIIRHLCLKKLIEAYFDLINACKAKDYDSVRHRNSSRREFFTDTRLTETLWDEKIGHTPSQVSSKSLLALIK